MDNEVLKRKGKEITDKMSVAAVLTILQLISPPSYAFNLWTEGNISMSGKESSKFGYSVALWNDTSANTRVVVGAPRGADHNNLDREGFQLGNIYFCDRKGQCDVEQRAPHFERLYKSKKTEDEKVLDFGDHVKKYGIGFGESLSTLKNENSPMAACSPRYTFAIRKKVNGTYTGEWLIQPRGACYVIQDFHTLPELIVTFDNPYMNPKSVQYALIGFSSTLIKENELNLVMGGPLAFYEEGVAVNKPIGTRPKYFSRSTNSELNDPYDYDTYEGWQVAQGKFDGENTSIAVSVVNYQNKGKVKFYAVEIKRNASLREIPGNEVGAKFGYSLGVGDFDGDSKDDLLIGSPWAFVKSPRQLPDGGKVFIHYGPLDKNKEVYHGIPGSVEWGLFGFCVAGIGDINRDGYGDAAIAAPFDQDHGGTVYIYNGSPKGLNIKPTQIIRGSQISFGFRSLGFSMDGGMDVDGNGYPDVVLGAVESDKAILLMSSPVLRLVGDVSFENKSLDEHDSCQNELAGYRKVKGVCFDLNFDIQYEAYNFTDIIEAELQMILLDKSDPPKFEFRTNNDHRYNVQYKIYPAGSKAPKSGIVVFAKSDRTIIGKSVAVSVSVHLKPPAGTSQSAYPPPILDALTQTTFNTSIILTCADNNTCFSKPDMSIMAYGSTFVVGKDYMKLPILVEARNDPAYQVKVKVKHPESVKYHRVEGSGLIPECLYEKFVGVTSFDEFNCVFKFIESLEKVNFTLSFEQQNPYALMDQDSLTVDLEVTSDSNDIDPTDNKHSAKVHITTNARLYCEWESRPDSTTVKVNETLSLTEVQALSQQSHTHPVDKLGPKISQKFSLVNIGPSPVKGAKMNIQLALFRGDDRIFYLHQEPTTSENVTCDWPKINPWNMTIPDVVRESSTNRDEVAISRRKRQAIINEGEVQSDVSVTERSAAIRKARSREEPEYVSCEERRCLITCDVAFLDAGRTVSVTVEGYAVIANLDKINRKKIAIKSGFKIDIYQKGSIVVNPAASATTEINLLKPPESGLSAVPFWLLLLSVLGSILLIVIIVLLLWKAGFFKRNRPPTADQNRKSLLQSSDPADDLNAEEDVPEKI